MAGVPCIYLGFPPQGRGETLEAGAELVPELVHLPLLPGLAGSDLEPDYTHRNAGLDPVGEPCLEDAGHGFRRSDRVRANRDSAPPKAFALSIKPVPTWRGSRSRPPGEAKRGKTGTSQAIPRLKTLLVCEGILRGGLLDASRWAVLLIESRCRGLLSGEGAVLFKLVELLRRRRYFLLLQAPQLGNGPRPLHRVLEAGIREQIPGGRPQLLSP